MSEYFIQSETLTGIADAIRSKTGSTDPISVSDMAGQIKGIQAVGGDDGSFKAVIERTAVNPTLPSDLTRIGDYAFYSYSSLALTSLPPGIMSIGNLAFSGCTSLKSLTFEGKPSSISNSAFRTCINLTTINVPWAEGEVANPPWGASYATINYNYTGEATE